MFDLYDKSLAYSMIYTCHSFGVEDTSNATVAINIPLLAEWRAVPCSRSNEQHQYKNSGTKDDF
jgi:hypothetical protein